MGLHRLMPHNFNLKDPNLGHKKRTINLKGMSYVPDMGFRKLYACNSCHNLQTQTPTCMICYQDDTLLALSQVVDKDTVGIIPESSNHRE